MMGLIKNTGKNLLRYWASMRLGIILLTAITIVSILGSFIPQREDPGVYYAIYGGIMAPLIIKLGFTNVFYSCWYIILAISIGLNLCLCAGQKLFKSIHRISNPGWKKDIHEFKNINLYQAIEVRGGNVNAVAGELKRVFKCSNYRVFAKLDSNATALTACSGTFGCLGSPLLHLALVVIIAGSFLSGVYGKSTSCQVPVSGMAELTQEGYPFNLKVDDFQVNYYPDGSPSQYQSNLSAVVMGKTEVQKTISVNNPLSYKGVKVYQASYGWLIKGSLEKGAIKHNFTVENGGLIQLPQIKELALQVRFYPDYYLDKTGHPASRSEKPLNPKLIYVLYQNSTLIEMGVAGLGETIQLGDLTLYFDRYDLYTGLIVKKDLGFLVVLAGFIILMSGLGLHFYVKPRYVWALITPNEDGVTIHLAGQGQNNHDHDLKDNLEAYMSNMVGVDKKSVLKKGCMV
ncbi:cytochrome c biogenesis protein ResB [Desulfoscipio gibsoniae]|uniref:ResB protein required for cytochrome c biosynthesis n=1 Tax=Desulfoscipio gibsoniae DSM 7213 TaxID=767817 RepID=R4KL82_9FIRM|nr:cytochrome c biogenesis protein ResB [Desulfoscipio gibsoniae]AGL02332.1 ResB protein required for cytochrome c biosynthesis [Desulfoscipio gibsoniae DSM 7213]